ncbi:hypothetical protein BDQ94DRAFT_141382 [Aspergillus welwitschiae]|uniref:Uncharacterized protein n=1 Tax=Aspergillus welwitschiae TaxID=1341132 RepID=A0A3F3Q5H9_9EURO|nr:hypothetical protein BDQ94DRAFT_141382 [Aspergillus welwitschiae]RDH34389.1 hypothetical protein BDQ94DRAFT_141382 [Aspergillus welwitschiae]
MTDSMSPFLRSFPCTSCSLVLSIVLFLLAVRSDFSALAMRYNGCDRDNTLP